MTMQQAIAVDPICRHNLFVAIKPPPEVAARIGRERDRIGRGDGRVRDDRLHLTLLMIRHEVTSLSPALIARIDDAMAALTAEAFDLTFDRFRPNGGTLALFPRHGGKEVRALREQMELLLDGAGLLAGKARAFNPHISLFYRPMSPGSGRIAPIGWQAAEVVLIDSHVGLTRHVELAHWPLRRQWRLL